MSRLTRKKRLSIAVALTLGFALVEAAGGLWTGSLALFADAGHMAVDAAALFLSLIGVMLAARPPGERSTFGWKRVEVLAAWVNALLFLVLTGALAWEAVLRFQQLRLPHAGGMAAVGLVGLLVNVMVALGLQPEGEADLNLRSARLHVFGDLLSSIGVVAGAWLTALTGWAWVDPALSLLILIGVLFSAVRLLSASGRILLEMSPAGIEPHKIACLLKEKITDVHDVHHIHLWEVGSGEVHLTAHLVVPDIRLSEGLRIQQEAQRLLQETFSIAHGTFQLEPEEVVQRYPLK